MRSRHVDVKGYNVTFDFMGKSGKRQQRTISNRRLARIIKQLDEMPGYELFRYVGADGKLYNISSKDVNDYIKKYMGENFSAKDFRTWGGTLNAIALLSAKKMSQSEKDRKKAVTKCVKKVAKRLGNTPAIAKASYIDPSVIEQYSSGKDFNRIKREVEKLRAKKYISSAEMCALKILT